MPFKKIIISLVFLLSLSTLSAQMGWAKGEIFLSDGSSQKGLVKLSIHSKSLLSVRKGQNATKFKASRKAKKITYKPGEIDHLVIDDSFFGGHYEYVSLSDKKKALFRIIDRGNVILYQRYVIDKTNLSMYSKSTTGSPFESEYYVKRPTETVLTPMLTDALYNKFEKKASAYFSDCPTLLVKIKNGTYTRGSIKKVVRHYNSCHEAK